MNEVIAKKIFIKLTLVIGIILFCLFSLKDNFAYTAFLKIQNSVDKYEIRKKISFLGKQLENIYLEIGRKISTQDIDQEQVKKEINDLIALGQQYRLKIDNNKDQIIMSEERLKKRVVFEGLLKQLFSAEAPKRLEAISILRSTDIKKSLPYLGVLLIEPDTSVRQEAERIINQVIRSSSKEIKKRIPNIEYLPKVNLVDNETSQEYETNEESGEKRDSM